ncbi:MAG: threonine/serine dehydratase [Polyangiaceae bacterium]
MARWPIRFEDALAARNRLRTYLHPTPFRNYATLDEVVGHGIRVFVKHDNHHPTNSFKVRNALSVLSALSPEGRRIGAVAASRGNHGQGLAWAGQLLGVPVTICVPVGNNPEKNAAMRGLGAEVIEEGADYDASVAVADRVTRERNARLVHSSNDAQVIAGAGTATLEMLEQEPELDALVIAIGGGSLAVGAMTVARTLKPSLEVYGVQAEGASAIFESWKRGEIVVHDRADTFADGLATRRPYELTFPALQDGLRGFVTVSEAELAEAVRVLVKTTHNLAEGAGAAGLAGLVKLRPALAGKRVGVILSGANVASDVLARIMNRTL